MPTKDEHIRALRAAVDAGDMESAAYIAGVLDRDYPTATQLQQEDFESRPAWDQARIGVGESLMALGTGIADLATPDDSEPGIVTQMKDDLALSRRTESGAKSAGSLLGTVGQLTPSSMVATSVPRAAGLGTPAVVGADLALGGAMDYARMPAPGETRAENALVGTAGALGGHALGQTLEALGRGVPRTATADALIDEGIPLTPGQAADTDTLTGKAVKWAERRMGDLPGVAGRVGNRQREAQEAWNKKLLNEVNPLREGRAVLGENPPLEVTKVGTDGMQNLQDNFAIAYEDIWKGVTPTKINQKPMAKDLREGMARLDKDVPTDLQPEAARIANRAKEEVLRFVQTGDTAALKRADELLRDGMYIDNTAADWFNGLRTALHSGLPEDAAKKMLQVNADYANYAVLQRAASYKAVIENGGVFRPTDLTSAVKAKGSESQVAAGRSRMQDAAKEGADTIDGMVPREESFGQKLTLPAVGAAAYVAPGTTLSALVAGNLAASRAGRNLLTGQSGLSKAAAALRPPLAAAGRAAAVRGYMNPHEEEMARLRAEALRRSGQ